MFTKRKVDTGYELLTRIFYAAVCIKKIEVEFGRRTRYRHTQVSKCTEFDGEIFEHLF
jgi:hypothetical protein